MIDDEIIKPHLHTTKIWKDKAKEWVKGKKCEWCGAVDNLAVHHIFHTEMVRKLFRYQVILKLIKTKLQNGEIPAKYKTYTTFKCAKCGRDNASINATYTSSCTFGNRATYTSIFSEPGAYIRFTGDMDHFKAMKTNRFKDEDLGYGTCASYCFDEKKQDWVHSYVKSKKIKVLDTYLDEGAYKKFINDNESSINQELAKIKLPNPFTIPGLVQKDREIHFFDMIIDTTHMDISKETDYMDFSIDTIVLCRDCHFAYKNFNDLCPICKRNSKKRWNKTCISCKQY